MSTPQETATGTSVMRVPAFRRLWLGLGLSSLGDWVGLLALTALASMSVEGYAEKNYAIAAVLFLRVLPAIVIGPLAGYVADHLDRRRTLIWGDYLRGLLFVSIPVLGPVLGMLTWVFVVTVLVEVLSLLWGPAKDATIPNLVSPGQLEQANQLGLAATYGSAVPAAGIFALLTTAERFTGGDLLGLGAVEVALYFNGLTFLASGLVIARLPGLQTGPASDGSPSVMRAITDGWSFVARTPMIRGLVIGMAGAFAAGGVVVGLARTYVGDLGGGEAGYGVLFGAVFAGMGLGLLRGSAWLPRLERRQVFGVALLACGVVLTALALIPRLEIVTALAVAVGFFAGTAWVTGMTLLGLETPDELRGRTFAFVGSLVRLVLALVLALAPLIAGSLGSVSFGPLGSTGDPAFDYRGAALTILLAGLGMAAVGATAYRLMQPAEGVLSDE